MKQLSEKAKGRQNFFYKDQLIYEWEQTIDEIHIFIKPPDFILPKNKEILQKQLKPGQEIPKLEVVIMPNHVKIWIKGFDQTYIDEDLIKNCTIDESYWMIEDDELHIQLQKMYKGEVWDCVFKGHNKLDPFTQEEVQKKLLLERFQEENPTFDFSQAEFNGQSRDPRTFMGGIKYK